MLRPYRTDEDDTEDGAEQELKRQAVDEHVQPHHGTEECKTEAKPYALETKLPQSEHHDEPCRLRIGCAEAEGCKSADLRASPDAEGPPHQPEPSLVVFHQ
jgi:hypothetical protein